MVAILMIHDDDENICQSLLSFMILVIGSDSHFKLVGAVEAVNVTIEKLDWDWR